jgi:outer membrane protein assembly factor BamB
MPMAARGPQCAVLSPAVEPTDRGQCQYRRSAVGGASGSLRQSARRSQLAGNSGSAGPTVTAGGLVFVGATNDRRFRAFDARTGEQLWETGLNGNANANPMTYRGSDGKQYVAINASGVIMVYSL